MRRLSLAVCGARSVRTEGSLPIGAGLAILAAAIVWPGVPAVTAMALVALGATSVTLTRFRSSPALLSIMMLNLVVYGGLYTLFVGATLHAATQSGAGLSFLVVADLAASVVLLAITLRRVVHDLTDAQSAPH